MGLSRRGYSIQTRSPGFSLLELLLVVAILALLFTLYWSPGSGSRERALHAACQRNLQKLHIGLAIFANDHEGKFPVVPGAKTSAEALDPLVPKYDSDIGVLICPAGADSVSTQKRPLRELRISYAYYMGRGISNSQEALSTDRQVDAMPKAKGQQLFSADGRAPGNNHGKNGGNVLFCDGHVQQSPPVSAFPLPVRPGEMLLNPE